MRHLASLGLIAIVACSSGPDEGAVLTFTAPDGFADATRLEVVLASADPAAITEVERQRTTPGLGDKLPVRYYRQRARGGSIVRDGSVNGFELRIEPDLDVAADETFIPFVLVFDGDQLIGVGAVADAVGDPAPVKIKPGVITRYAVTVSPVTVSADAATVAQGDARIVGCYDAAQQPWRSGYAWWPAADPAYPAGHDRQLRLLLPDLGADPAATDATSRSADLDCDAHAAAANDCDDLRPNFFEGAPESCDGLDTNCDDQRFFAEACPLTNQCPQGGGVALCDDQAGTASACAPSAACRCATGGNGACTKCLIDHTGAGAQAQLCAPADGIIQLPGCTDGALCTVSVLAATQGWRASIAALPAGPFGLQLTAARDLLYLRVKPSSLSPISTANLGEVYLAIRDAQGVLTTMPILLDLGGTEDMCVIDTLTGSSDMHCSP